MRPIAQHLAMPALCAVPLLGLPARALRTVAVRAAFCAGLASLSLASLSVASPALAADAPGGDSATPGSAAAASDAPDAAKPAAAPEAAKAADAPSAGEAGRDATDADGQRRSALTRELAEQGEAELFKSVRVFQQRYLVKTKRVELAIGGGTTFGDPFAHHFSVDAALLFHLSEQWAFGGGASKWFGSQTEGFHQIESDYGLFPEESRLQAGGWGEVQFSPVAGKFSGFGLGVMQGDAYLLAGGGAARTTRGESLKPFGLIGTGLRMHVARWLSISMELRNLVMPESFLDDESRVLQHWFGGLKLGIWLPPNVQYQFPR